MAIIRLKQTYSRAHRVLVLSEDLDFDVQDPTPLEFFMRIFCSSWMRRLWTLQEGVLAQRLSIYMSGKVYDLDDIHKSFDNYLMKHVVPVGHKLLLPWHDWRALANPQWQDVAGKEVSYQKLSSLQAALKFRKTSKKEDEAVCLASILGLDVEYIIGARTAVERMKRFWKLVKVVPIGIPFTRDPRLQDAPFRWAPASMLNSGTVVNDNSRCGMVRENGLHLQTTGWVLNMNARVRPQHSFHFHDETGAYFTVFSDHGTKVFDGRHPGLTQYAILMLEPLATLAQKPQLSYPAIKISLQQHTLTVGAVIQGRFQERVDFVVVPEDEWADRRHQEEVDQKAKRNPSRYLTGNCVGPQQSWVLQ